MLSSLQVGSKLGTGNWRKNFPTGVLESRSKSCSLVKKLLGFTVSNILYLRTPLDESDFRSTDFEGIPLKLLNDSSPNRVTKQICDLVMSATKAIDKGYLKDLILAFYNNGSNPEEAIETHTFHFAYTEEGNVAVSVSGDDTLVMHMTVLEKENELFEQTFHMLKKTIQVAQSLKDLPRDAQFIIKLTYYDTAPADYEPDGFSRTEMRFRINEEVPPVNAGQLKSGFHSLGVDTRSKLFMDSVARMLSQPSTQDE